MALINYITPIQFACGAISALDAELSRLDISKPLIITDQGIIKAGIYGSVTDNLGARAHAIFGDTAENPTEDNLRGALTAFTASKCDGLIAVGGGSPMDLGKAVALLVSQGGTFADYDIKTGGSEKIRRVLPHIAIPTAAGTGAEIGRACVLTTDDGRKRVAVSLEMVAHGIICDPELTLSLPPVMTAATGIDALSHGIETFLSPRYNPPADTIALDAVRRIAGNIETATHDGANIESRSEMLMGALMGGMALQKGLGSAHAMANPLGELHHHHGTLIGILLPHVIAFNSTVSGERIGQLAAAIGLQEDQSLAMWAADLVQRLGLPTSLRELGIDRSCLASIAAKAEKDHLSATNPRPAAKADYNSLLNAAWNGPPTDESCRQGGQETSD